MYSQENLNKILSRFIQLVSSEINLRKVYLFGSYAKGKPHEYSDIDLALVSDDFEGSRFFDKRKTNKFLLKTTTDLQIHPYRPEDFTEDDPFVAEILRTGIRIV